MNDCHIAGGFPAAAFWAHGAKNRKKRNYRAELLSTCKTLEKTMFTRAWLTDAAYDWFYVAILHLICASSASSIIIHQL
jgi:hypothetical protein